MWRNLLHCFTRTTTNERERSFLVPDWHVQNKLKLTTSALGQRHRLLPNRSGLEAEVPLHVRLLSCYAPWSLEMEV
jgi:hypothetical protein